MKHPAVADLEWLRAFVVKDGVLLGGLTESQRRAALALAWAGLPPAAAYSEPQINAALKEQLAGALRCVDVDHVELRRWLVDNGFLARDGFGHRYTQTSFHALDAKSPLSAEAARLVMGSLADEAPAAWAEGLRRAHHAERAARRERHLARQPA
jgi:hypothetical protein